MNAHVLAPLFRAADSTARDDAAPTRRICFEVPAAQALTFRARHAGALRVLQGRLWATRDGSAGLADDDQVLGEGAALPLARGERVVLESWSTGEPGAAWFCWETRGR